MQNPCRTCPSPASGRGPECRVVPSRRTRANPSDPHPQSAPTSQPRDVPLVMTLTHDFRHPVVAFADGIPWECERLSSPRPGDCR